MKLFDLTFKNDIPGTDGLFYKGDKCALSGNSLTLQTGGTADFGTYFNLLSYCTYRTYCGIESAALHLYGEGRYTVNICLKTKEGCVSVLQKLPADGDFTAQIDISALPDGGYLYFTLTAQTGCSIYGGAWHCSEDVRRNVKIGIAICTYKREGFVKANLARITEGIENQPDWADRLHVFIVDNAGTLNLQNTPYYAVINNKNLGGSGGFTRGMCEICGGEYTHMLLMDDDISFDFQTLKRTWTFASLLTDEHKNATIGGAMLVLEDPCIQHEFGGIFDGVKQHSINSKLDMTLSCNLVKNENAQKPGYNAWWYCCMPVNNVKNYGLPMPFFIKEDDIEYGIRCKSQVVCTSGLAVWHSNFDGKYNGALEYYIKRNEAVVCAIHCDKSAFTAAFKFLYAAHVQLLLKDYAAAEIVINGYNDFLQGSRFFMQADHEKLNGEVMSKKPQNLTYRQIEEASGVNPEDVTYKKPLKSNIIKKAVLFAENYFPSFMLKDSVGVVDVCGMVPSRAYRKKTVIKSNSAAQNGYICTFDKKRRKALRGQITKIFFKLLFGYKKIKKDYRDNAVNMCSRELWDRLFGN